MARNLKNSKVKLDLLTDIDVINGKKGIRGGICHAIHWYVKVNGKYMKIMMKIKNCHILIIGM